METIKRCFIVCAGPEGCGSAFIPKDSFVICADGGYEKAMAAGIRPDLLIGDFDSIGAMPDDVKEIIKAPSHKDQTDTLLAVMTAEERGFTDITLLGACMGRVDHTIANLQTLKYMSKRGLKGRIAGECTDAFFLKDGSIELAPDKSRYLSVFSLTDKSEISIRGAEYPLEHYIMSDSEPIGVSNEFCDTVCKITVYSGEVIVLTVKK